MAMNEEQAKALIHRASAHMNNEAFTKAVNALATADRERRTFRTTLATAHWQLHDDGGAAIWQATLITHSTEVRAIFEMEEKAMVWLANRLGAIMWAHDYATRHYAEVVIPTSKPAR